MSYQKKDGEKSIRFFEKFAVHAIKAHFGGDALIHSYEDSNNPVEHELDLKFGIDGVIVGGDGWSHNYASRVQFGKPYNTFTLRGYRPSGAATEIDKLRRGQQIDEPKPEYHIHTYVDSDGRGAVVGICETVELYQWIHRHKPEMIYNRQGDAGFFAVDFAALDSVRVFYVDSYGNVRDVTERVKMSAA